jgi:tRNA-5-methyluridine54 2-sulfurtransferase
MPLMMDIIETADHGVETVLGRCKSCNELTQVVRMPEFNLNACPSCFLRLYERRLRRKLEEFDMLRGAKRVAVALSGGKDSVAMLLAMQRLGWVMDFEVTALHFHLGMGEYSDTNLRMVEELTGNLGLPLHLVRIEDLGLEVRKVKGWNPCAVCGAIKRALFNREARASGAQVVATAHTLEDILLFTLKNLLSRRYTFPRPVLPEQPGLLRKVKPVMFTPERLNAIYCRLRQVDYYPDKCPFWVPHPHRLKEVFELLEEIVPSGKLQLLLSLQQAFPAEGDEVHLTELQTCATCGDPSTQPVCALCHLREFLDA